jgi:hypothetical protein
MDNLPPVPNAIIIASGVGYRTVCDIPGGIWLDASSVSRLPEARPKNPILPKHLRTLARFLAQIGTSVWSRQKYPESTTARR